jgi:exopolyphosphatase/guanosine-5'-triphosphate,3'-diphosphate pyrophosphatase
LSYKVAVIDIGTYSTRLLIAGIHEKGSIEETLRSVDDILSVGRITSLGRNLKETGYLQREAIDETLATLREYVLIAREYKVERIIGYATAACRDAENGNEFLEKAKQLGIEINLITGDQEAYLSFLASAYGLFPEESFVVIDQGGGSTEFAYGIRENGNYRLKTSLSFSFGIVNLTERFLKSDPPDKYELKEMKDFIAPYIKEAFQKMGNCKEIIGLGGTITTLAALEYHIFPYSSYKVHGKILNKLAIKKWLEKLSSMPLTERKKIPQIEDKRAEAIISGIVIFDTALDLFKKDSIRVSDWGLRHGAVIKYILDKFSSKGS